MDKSLPQTIGQLAQHFDNLASNEEKAYDTTGERESQASAMAFASAAEIVRRFAGRPLLSMDTAPRDGTPVMLTLIKGQIHQAKWGTVLDDNFEELAPRWNISIMDVEIRVQDHHCAGWREHE